MKAKRSKTAKAKVAAKHKPAKTPLIAVGDVVEKKFGNTMRRGTITMYDESKHEVSVQFEQGEEIILPLRDVNRCPIDTSILPSTPVHPDQPGFNQYEIEWTDSQGNKLIFGKPKHDDPTRAICCRAQVEGIRFYGSWRKTRTRADGPGYCIDLYANYDGKSYTLSPLLYPEHDPRVTREDPELDDDGDEVSTKYSGMRDLNSDICIAINKFLHFHLSGNVETITDLRNKAENPVVTFKSFEALREAITGLIQLYDRSRSSGGLRSYTLKGDTPESVPVRVECNLTHLVIASGFEIPAAPPIPEAVDENGNVPVGNNGSGGTVRTPKSRSSSTRLNVPNPTGTLEELEAQKQAINSIPGKDRTPEQKALAKKIRQAIRDEKDRLGMSR